MNMVAYYLSYIKYKILLILVEIYVEKTLFVEVFKNLDSKRFKKSVEKSIYYFLKEVF